MQTYVRRYGVTNCICISAPSSPIKAPVLVKSPWPLANSARPLGLVTNLENLLCEPELDTSYLLLRGAAYVGAVTKALKAEATAPKTTH